VRIRRPAEADARAVTELIRAEEIDMTGEAGQTEQDLRKERAVLDLARDVWLVEWQPFASAATPTTRSGSPSRTAARSQPERSPTRHGASSWIAAIGVRKPWRRRGVGHALLLHCFCELHARGKQKIALGVDAENPTGATRLYERAGMHVARSIVWFEKAL
jgi:GNAT superfamily N-acetyltransferase